MRFSSLFRLFLLLAAPAALFLATGCGREDEDASNDGGLPPVRVQIDWTPEPQHGGLYQAMARGWFAEEGVAVTVAPGGRNINVLQMLSAGRVDIAQAASNQVLLAAAQGAPVTILTSAFHEVPTSLMMHDENPVRSFEDLDGKILRARPESLFLPYLKRKYDIDFTVAAVDFSLGPFLADPTAIRQGFYIAEFYYIEKAGITPRALRLREAGYENALVLAANTDWLRENPEAAQGFVTAYVRGWRDYLEADPTPGHTAMIEANAKLGREIAPAFLDFSRALILRDRLARGDLFRGEDYGSVPLALYERQVEQLEALGKLEPGQLRAEDAVAPQYAERAHELLRGE